VLLDGPRSRRAGVRWADLTLLVVIAGLVALWWTHPPAAASVHPAGRPPGLAAATMPTSTQPDAYAWLSPLASDPVIVAAGTVRPSATFTPVPPAPTPVPSPIQHTVADGETVGEIAEQYDVKTSDLIALNNLGADAFINVGQVLLIPGSALPPTPTPVPTPTGGTLIYIVQDGDTISDLAVRFGADMNVVLQANHMQDGDVLSVGQSIVIPLSVDTPQPTVTLTPTPPPPTFTPQSGYAAPALLTPADDSAFGANEPILLTWTSVDLLADDEWYVAILRVAGTGELLPPYWTKTTSWRLPDDYHAAGGRDYLWQVLVVRGKPDDSSAQPVPISPPSLARHFTWK